MHRAPIAIAACCLLTLTAQAQKDPKLQLQDAILAVVDEVPILASDVERVIVLGLAEAQPEESDEELRRRVLEQLIDERLRLQEVERFGFEELPLEAIEAEVARIRGRFASPDVFARRLASLGLTEDGLRQLVARQLLVWIYVDERLGPRVFVDADDIQTYYRTVLTPQLKGAALEVPPLDEVREQIRLVLKEQRLNQEIRDWTDSLRLKADVQVLDQRRPDLPPVVDRIEQP